jgi:hypothetical protein
MVSTVSVCGCEGAVFRAAFVKGVSEKKKKKANQLVYK